ncbi:MAG: hypothetical protein EAZ76_02630 [Nostocales cyanobacterium]|nr:MAG: hypothetical protein EAZ87_21750 [Nostocales cyanobacterium]TAF19876.1 MAG: hypothetical protein EAZ76_02630 [Nostocales cyanobacterium]
MVLGGIICKKQPAKKNGTNGMADGIFRSCLHLSGAKLLPRLAKIYTHIQQADHRRERATTSRFVKFALTEIHKKAKTDLSNTSFENQTNSLG